MNIFVLENNEKTYTATLDTLDAAAFFEGPELKWARFNHMDYTDAILEVYTKEELMNLNTLILEVLALIEKESA